MKENWYQKQSEGWRMALEGLRSSGWVLELTSAAYPVMIEGSLPSGDKFAVYAKEDYVEFGVGGSDPGDIPEWAIREDYPEASWLPPDDGMAILHPGLVRSHMVRPSSSRAWSGLAL